jgi:hypothetical protein
VSKGIPVCIQEAKRNPAMRDQWSHKGRKYMTPLIGNISRGKACKNGSSRKRLQLSNYMNDLLATNKPLQTIDNHHHGQCFVCQCLHEDMQLIFQWQLAKQHMPDMHTWSAVLWIYGENKEELYPWNEIPMRPK